MKIIHKNEACECTNTKGKKEEIKNEFEEVITDLKTSLHNFIAVNNTLYPYSSNEKKEHILYEELKTIIDEAVTDFYYED